MITEEQLNKLKETLTPHVDSLGKYVDLLLDKEVSNYPIFIASKNHEIELGIPLDMDSSHPRAWVLKASTLEEFVAKQLIRSDKVADFKSVYKNPKNHVCLFCVTDFGATFVFIKRN